VLFSVSWSYDFPVCGGEDTKFGAFHKMLKTSCSGILKVGE
jgi:hypothetical protein